MKFRTQLHGLCAAAILLLALPAVQAADTGAHHMDAHHKHAHMTTHDASHASAIAQHKGKVADPRVKASKHKQDSSKSAKPHDDAHHGAPPSGQ